MMAYTQMFTSYWLSKIKTFHIFCPNQAQFCISKVSKEKVWKIGRLVLWLSLESSLVEVDWKSDLMMIFGMLPIVT